MSYHGNSYKNEALHHLYVIIDSESDDIFKYGITDDPEVQDGLPKRVQEQLELFNRIAGIPRFYALILVSNIPGRRKAREIETQHIVAYKEKHGRRPVGNLKD
jgi:hypothetical protein